MSFFGSLFGTDASEAANRAAADQYAKETAATKNYTAYGDTLPAAYADLARGYEPYATAGTSALDRLLAGLGLGGNGEDFTAAYHALPGYQSGLATGQQAAERALNAGGGLNRGAAIKGLYRYGSDYEDSRAGDYLSRLMGLTTTGMTATGANIGTKAAGLTGQQAVRQSAYGGAMKSAPTVGQGMVAGAQSEQNALTNLLGMAAYLGGSALGGPLGGAMGKSFFGGK
jgi:hypothetical protein